MFPKENLTKFAAAVSKRCGICQATVEQVLPAMFDEIRFRLVEGKYPNIPIDSFGTFAVVTIPEREYHYTYKGADEIRHLPPKKRLKFAAAYNFRKELESGIFDPTRRSFTRHPKDPIIRRRQDMRYKPNKTGMFKGATKKVKSEEGEVRSEK